MGVTVSMTYGDLQVTLIHYEICGRTVPWWLGRTIRIQRNYSCYDLVLLLIAEGIWLTKLAENIYLGRISPVEIWGSFRVKLVILRTNTSRYLANVTEMVW